METDETHVYPLFGREHILAADYWCQPQPDPEYPSLLIHNPEQ
jgi:hypothetical protein